MIVDFSELMNDTKRMSIRHNDSVRWVACNVLNYEADYFEVSTGMEKLLMDKIVSVGDMVKCKFFSSDFNYEYIVMGFIEKIVPNIPYSYMIKAVSFEKQEFLRKSPRYDVYLSAILKFSPDDADGIFITVNNISKSGLAFQLEYSIDKYFADGSKPVVYVDAFISNNRFISIAGNVVRKSIASSNIEYGVSFSAMDEESVATLEDYISELVINP